MSFFLRDCWQTYKARLSLNHLKLVKSQTEYLIRSGKLVTQEEVQDDEEHQQSERHLFCVWLMKSCLFFTVGVLLIFIIYFFMINQLQYDEMIAVYVCVPLGIVLPLMLAFSLNVRYIISLSLPQLCSGNGRIVLLSYIFIVAHNGPMRNAMSNFQVLVNSTVCLQYKVVNLLPPFLADNLRLMPDPLNGHLEFVNDTVEGGPERMNETMMQLRLAYITIEALFNETWEQVDRHYGWLKDKQIICRKLKTKIDYAIDGLSGRLFNSWRVIAFTPWLPTTVQRVAKAIVKDGFSSACGYDDPYDFFGIRALLRNRMVAIGEYVKQESDFSVHFNHHYSYKFNQSKSFGKIRDEILTDILDTFGWIKKLLNIMSLTLGSTLFLVFIKSLMYRRNYGRSGRFDNYYISTELIELDRRRELMGLETILPLRRRERRNYVSSIFSPRLVTPERKKFVANVIVWMVAALNVAYCIAIDYAIYWFANTLNAYGGVTITLQGAVIPRLEITGDGIFSSMFRGIAEAFDPFTNSYVPSVDLTPCLPKPNLPDHNSHIRIGQLMLLLLLLTLIGSWLLRLRHVIAAIYNPSMNVMRAVWLHRNILIQRTFGFKQLKKNLRKSFVDTSSHLASGFLEYLTLSRPWFGKLFRFFGYKQSFCLICGERLLDDDSYIKCDNVDCKGIYCEECYNNLKNICPLCANPVNYGDNVDASEECDSSDDDCFQTGTIRLSTKSSSESDDDIYDASDKLLPTNRN